MTVTTWKDPAVRQGWARISQTGPFVYGLTNYIAANLSADVLLAARRVEVPGGDVRLRPRLLTAAHYVRIAQVLEQGLSDFAFVPDALAVPRSLNGSFDPAVKWGSGTPRLDPVPVISLMAAVTTRLGVAATVSTGYHEPYNVARQFATIDHLTGGRSGWNVVTSFQDAEAQNFGQPKLPPRPERYARAEEFLEVATRLWDSWADDAIVADKTSGVFGRPEAVTAIDHDGERFRVQGPLSVPRPPQGYPVIIQAGASESGRDFAARWADVTAGLDEVIRGSADGTLVCALRQERFEAGHIPGSTSLPYPELLRADGTVDVALVRERAAGLTPDTIVYCGGGINAAGLLLALEAAGLPLPRLYDGSLTEWRADPTRPLDTGAG